MLFDLFVTAQRVRRVLADGMAESGLRPDEYAIYSLLFEAGPMTATEMSDGRALQLRLNRAGLAAQRRARDHWNVVRKRIENALPIPVNQVRSALQALDDAAVSAGSRDGAASRRAGR